jgi:TolA-binding protein
MKAILTMKRHAFTIAIIFTAVIGLSSCKPRTNRNRNTARNPTTPTATQQGTSAKQVLSRTDSAIARVAAMNNDPELDRPPVATDEGASTRTPWGANYVPRPNNSDYDAYQAGLGAYNAGQYDQAIGAFSQTVVAGRPPEMVPNAYYWMGESYFAMQRYAESLPYFEYVTNAGPEYKRTMAFYKLSLANNNLGNRQAANLWYERLRNEYPRSTYSKKLASLGMR